MIPQYNITKTLRIMVKNLPKFDINQREFFIMKLGHEFPI